jgi:hypothetical protein
MKPSINHYPAPEEIQFMENNGHVFEMHGDKRIVGRSAHNGYEILFLEDETEIIRAPDGTFIEEWPKGA